MPEPSFAAYTAAQDAARGPAFDERAARMRAAEDRQKYDQLSAFNYDFNNPSATGNMTARDAHNAILEEKMNEMAAAEEKKRKEQDAAAQLADINRRLNMLYQGPYGTPAPPAGAPRQGGM